MATKDQVLDMSPLGMRFTVLQSRADTGNRSLDLHWELLPGCNMKEPLIHIHPNAVETYEILDGEMEFFIKDHWVRAKTGDHISVERGVKHSFRNPSGKAVKVFNTHQPAFRMEEYFEDVCKIIDKLTNNRRQELKMNLKAKLYMALLMNRYRNEIIATSPPDILIKMLGSVAKTFKMQYD